MAKEIPEIWSFGEWVFTPQTTKFPDYSSTHLRNSYYYYILSDWAFWVSSISAAVPGFQPTTPQLPAQLAWSYNAAGS
jgi:hypothetical protein